MPAEACIMVKYGNRGRSNLEAACCRSLPAALAKRGRKKRPVAKDFEGDRGIVDEENYYCR